MVGQDSQKYFPLSADVGLLEGLGGTSLLNANVFMPADRKTMASKIWPKEIRDEGLEMCTVYTFLTLYLQWKSNAT